MSEMTYTQMVEAREKVLADLEADDETVYSTPVKGIRGDEERVQRVIGRLQDAASRNGAEVIIRTAEIGAVLNALTFATLPRHDKPEDKPGVHDHRDHWEKGRE